MLDVRIFQFGITVKHQLNNWSVKKSIYTDQNEKLIALLRKIRVEAGLTQVQLAERLGQKQSFISKYESGERRLDLIQLRQICVAVGMPLEKFVRRFEKSLK